MHRSTLPLLWILALACDSDSSRAGAASADSAGASTLWVVTPSTVGPLRLGVPLSQASMALGDRLKASYDTDLGPCDYVFPKSLPPGTSLMVVRDTVVRVDIDSGATATAEGARIGDTVDRIRALYSGRLRQEPHKYTEGHYLIVRSNHLRDSSFRIVFETDGGKVVKYRAGQLPAAEWVEGCS